MAEALRVAASPKYNCVRKFNGLRAEVESELANLPKGGTIEP